MNTDAVAVPATLVRQLSERRVVLFVGAGLSAQAGLPMWRTLLEDLVEVTTAETRQDPSVVTELGLMLSAGKFLQIAEYCKEKLGPSGYTQLLSDRLADADREVPSVHRLAVALPFAAWVTTNYDKLLERAYALERGGLPKTLTNRDTEALGRLLFDGAPFILKAHGDLDKPESVVFTSRDYRDLIHGNPAFGAAFSTILMTNALLFVGYSLSDPDFNLLMDRQLLTFRGFAPERYALMSGIGKVEEEYLWRVCQIRVLPYPVGEHAYLGRFFEALAGALARLDGGTSGAMPVATAAAAAASVRRARSRASAPSSSSSGAVVASVASGTQAGRTHTPEVAPPQLTLALEWNQGRMNGTLASGNVPLFGPLPSPPARWETIVAIFRAGDDRDDAAKTSAAFGNALGDLLGDAFMAALAKAVEERSGEHIALALTRDTERLPWELLPVGGRTLGEAAPLYRLPVGVSAEARGLPACASPMRAFLIGDPSTDIAPLPFAAREVQSLAGMIQASGKGIATVAVGESAIFDAVRHALQAQPPDILHFAGHAWFDEHEPFLYFANQQRVTASTLRPLLSLAPPMFMFFNTHYTAFVPPGIETSATKLDETALHAGFGGRAGFADIAMRSGVGAFLGSFSGAVDDEGAQAFADGVYQELLSGATTAEAVMRARRLPHAQGKPTGLLFALHGAGTLKLP